MGRSPLGGSRPLDAPIAENRRKGFAQTMPDAHEVAGWRGRNVIGSDGDPVGKVVDLYVDAETGRPEWLAVNTGLVGSRVSFVPLEGAPRRWACPPLTAPDRSRGHAPVRRAPDRGGGRGEASG